MGLPESNEMQKGVEKFIMLQRVLLATAFQALFSTYIGAEADR